MYDHHFSNFSRPSPKIWANIQPQGTLVLEKICEGFKYMDMAAILVNGPPPFSQSFVLPS